MQAAVEASRYRIDRGWLTLTRVLSYGFLCVAAAAAVYHWLRPEELPFGIAATFVVAFGAIACVGLILTHHPDRYSVEVLDDGLRAVSGCLPWTMVVGLRERPFLERIDVLGPAGPSGIRLEYQLDGFPEVLTHVISRATALRNCASRRFPRPILTPSTAIELLAVVGFAAMGAWVWWSEHHWAGLFLVVGLPALVASEKLGQVSVVSALASSVVVRRGFCQREIPYDRIVAVELALCPVGQGRRYLDVFITEASGARTPIRPPGADPFALFAALNEAMRH